jgi:ectoine hydroxylase-related dioxygenase (phytanoyl-CoA dioxygenase family)
VNSLEICEVGAFKAQTFNSVPKFSRSTQFKYSTSAPISQNPFCVLYFRIHLDDTDEHNGALKVIPASHRKGIGSTEIKNPPTGTEATCTVKQGGLMLMKPLLLHRSFRTTNNKKRIACGTQLGGANQLEP